MAERATGAGVRTNLRLGPPGRALATDVFVPDGAAPVPTVVTRTPHGRSAHLAEGLGWRRRGFAFVVQDVRGRYDSAGTWEPYRGERADGAALVDWVTSQPWSDGRVVAAGGSYAAFTAWAAAVERPRAVRAVISAVPALGFDRVKFDPPGILRLAEHAHWWLERGDSRTSRDGLVAAMYADEPAVLDHLPVSAVADHLWAELPTWFERIAAGPVPGPEAVTDDELAGLDVAALHVGGWYDLLTPETLRLWSSVGAAHRHRPPRRLVLGPWDHDLVWAPSTTVGVRDHGRAARVDLGRLQVEWLAMVLDGARPSGPDVLGTTESASVFVIGAERWSHGPDWPSGSGFTTWHAGPDGALVTALDAAGAPSVVASYHYDPLDPFPSQAPATDRLRLDRRPDAARFRSAPLRNPLRIAGRPHASLVAATSAASADWVVRLQERRPDGVVVALAQGVVTSPGGQEAAHLGVDLDAIAVELTAGTVLELVITSSDFPALARNLGTGADRLTSVATRPSTNEIHTGTCVVLPTVPVEEPPCP